MKKTAVLLALVLVLSLALPALADASIDHMPVLSENGSVDFGQMTNDEVLTLIALLEAEATARGISSSQSTPETSYGASTDTVSATMGELNALRSAQNYLDFTAFSYTGLIDQLEYEGYSTEEATYGVDHCGADWMAQAAKSAANYLSFTSFSKSGLIDQLEYEGFTHEQAVYGAEQNGY